MTVRRGPPSAAATGQSTMSTIYVSPTGSGNKTGSDWANAIAGTNLNVAMKKAGAGGSVLLAADQGAYKITSPINISAAGTEGATITVKGVSSKTGAAAEAVFEGNRSADWSNGAAAGNELFKFQKGAANLIFEHLQANNTGTVFRAAADVSNITIQHVDADNVGRFFEDYAGSGNATAKVTGLTIRDVEVHGFSQGVVRLQYGSEQILIENVLGDSKGQDGEFAIGVHLHGATHDVVIRDTTMMNAKYTGTGYWNGDGFATEVGVKNVLFENTVASGNADAGYDLKSTATKLVNAVSSNNAHNYRIWGEAEMIDSVGLDPHRHGGTAGQYQVWVQGTGSLKMTGGGFYDAGSATTVFAAGANLVLDNVDVVMAAGAKLGGKNLPTGLVVADVVKTAALGTYSANSDALVDTISAAVVAAPVVTMPFQPAEATTTPGVITPPVVVTPVVTAPTKVVIAPPVEIMPAVDPAKTGTAPIKIASSAAGESFTASDKTAVFFFDLGAKQGADKIAGFGRDDLIVTSTALTDGNNDGIIAFGKNASLDLGKKMGTVSIEGLSGGLRLLGQTDEGSVYGAASIRPIKAQEGKLGAADTLTGDKTDKAANTFFFDTALDLDLGADTLKAFGAKDVIVTTHKLADIAVGGRIGTTDGNFTFGHDGLDLGHLAITDLAGAAVTTLEFDGGRIVGDVNYYVYSNVDSAAGVAALG